MTEIIICDDDEVLANKLAENVKFALKNIKEDYLNYRDKVTDVKVFTDSLRIIGYTQVTDISDAIFFLDIELDQGQNGVDIAEQIRQDNPNAQIIFVTAYDKYAPLTYRKRIGAIDYINKSESDAIIMKRLNETLLNAFESLEKAKKIKDKQFVYKVGRRTQRINQSDVLYVMNSTIQHKVVMVSKHGEADFRSNVSKIETENPFLMRISQSCLVNTSNISSIDLAKKIIRFSTGQEVKYSRKYNSVVKQLKASIEE